MLVIGKKDIVSRNLKRHGLRKSVLKWNECEKKVSRGRFANLFFFNVDWSRTLSNIHNILHYQAYFPNLFSVFGFLGVFYLHASCCEKWRCACRVQASKTNVERRKEYQSFSMLASRPKQQLDKQSGEKYRTRVGKQGQSTSPVAKCINGIWQWLYFPRREMHNSRRHVTVTWLKSSRLL